MFLAALGKGKPSGALETLIASIHAGSLARIVFSIVEGPPSWAPGA
jgi:hypothetical protein